MMRMMMTKEDAEEEGGGVTNRTYSSAQRFSGRNVHSPAVDRS